MGNHRFKLSDMIPNAWFYKLRDMGRGRDSRKHNTTPSRKKKQTSPPSITRYERVLQGFSDCSLIVFTSCKEIEESYLNYTEKQFGKPVLLSGFLVSMVSMDVLEEKWSKWLNIIPDKSVILCSFGSEQFVNDDQIREVAGGLELSGLPFILVLNFPSNLSAKAELERALPKRFLERVKNRGVVHTGWFQQQVILKHSTVGCHLGHGGFNYVIEALASDCELVLLPFKAHQFFNAKLIAKALEAGIEVNRSEDGDFKKEDIMKAVKTVMVEDDKEPGKHIKENHKRLQEWRGLYSLNQPMALTEIPKCINCFV